ncbi:MAG: Ger(x)C family spore germination protein [Bacilli bacterium]|nr:Ger(x)C family spore germination protein [Bacilli bacterium]
MKKIIVILLSTLLLTGCYDYKELNTIAIVSATSIDYINDEYIINAQVINPQAPDKTVVIGSPFIIYEGKGKTIQEAYRKVTASSSRFLYQNHLQLLLITDKIKDNKLKELIDFFARNPSVRTEFYVMLYKGDNPIDIITPINEISAMSIIETSETNIKFLGETLEVTFNDLINSYLNPNKEIIIPTIKQIGKSKDEDKTENTEQSKIKTNYEIKGLAIYKDNKVAGFLNEEETLAYNYISNNITNTIYTYECEKEKYITIEITKSKAETKIKNENVNINIKIKGNINENNCNIEMTNNKEIKNLEKNISKDINNFIKKNINNIIKEYNSDIFGFKDIVYKNDYNYYKKIINNKEWLKNINININTDTTILAEGSIFGGLNEKNK